MVKAVILLYALLIIHKGFYRINDFFCVHCLFKDIAIFHTLELDDVWIYSSFLFWILFELDIIKIQLIYLSHEHNWTNSYKYIQSFHIFRQILDNSQNSSQIRTNNLKWSQMIYNDKIKIYPLLIVNDILLIFWFMNLCTMFVLVLIPLDYIPL